MGGVELRGKLSGGPESLRDHQRALPRPLCCPTHQGHLHRPRRHHCGILCQGGSGRGSSPCTVGEDPEAHLDDGFLTAQDLPVPSPLRPGYEAYATGSHSSWGGSPAPESNHGQGVWGSPPPGASNRDTTGRAGHPSGGGASQDGVGTGHSQR